MPSQPPGLCVGLQSESSCRLACLKARCLQKLSSMMPSIDGCETTRLTMRFAMYWAHVPDGPAAPSAVMFTMRVMGQSDAGLTLRSYHHRLFVSAYTVFAYFHGS